jgi:hypothetical protein
VIVFKHHNLHALQASGKGRPPSEQKMKRAQTLPLHALARKAATPKIIAPRVFLRGIADKVPSLLRSSKLNPKAKLTQHQPCTIYLKPKHANSGSAAPSVGAQAQQSIERFKAHILPVYDRPEFVLHHGKGSYVWDTDGNKYLDFSAGIAVNALGHADEGVLKVCVRFHWLLEFFFFPVRFVSRIFGFCASGSSPLFGFFFFFLRVFESFFFGHCMEHSFSKRGPTAKDLYLFLIRTLCCPLQYPFCHWFDAEPRSLRFIDALT